jgi:RNA recognition motif-containing protein
MTMGTRLFVGNLNYSTSEDSLRAALSEGGRVVKEIHMPTDRETGRPRGFAFAEMGSDDDARKAIEALNGSNLDGRTLKVNEAQERPPRPSGGFGGGGGRGGYGGGGGGGGYGGGRGGDRDRGGYGGGGGRGRRNDW